MKFNFALAIVLAAGSLAGASAQVAEKYEGLRLNKISHDGRYVASSIDYTTIIDRLTGEVYNYGSTVSMGRSNGFSDEGTAVGATDHFSVPAYWKDGEWHALPHRFTNVSYTRAEAVSADGSLIVGDIDARSITRKSWPMVQPVIWRLNPDGNGYANAELLPIPELDVTGCLPQQVTTQGISADGTTIIAQVTDYMGVLQYQIVYTLNDDNSWSFTTSGLKMMVREGVEWPPYPKYPTKPKAENYLSSSEYEAYLDAYQRYTDSLEIQSLTGIYPHRPQPEEFIGEQLDNYNADMANYEFEDQNFALGIEKFKKAYATNCLGGNFSFNSVAMSRNGRYYSGNYVYPDPTFEGDVSEAGVYTSPAWFALGSPEEGNLIVDKSLSAFSMLDDGRIVAATPADDEYVWARTPLLINPAEGNAVTKFDEYLQQLSPESFDWLRDNFTISLTADQNDGVAVSDTLLIGSVRMNNTGRCMIGYVVEPNSYTYNSWVIDLDATPQSSVETTFANGGESIEISYNRSTGTLSASGNIASVEVFDINGRRLLSAAATTLRLSRVGYSGVAIVKATSAGGNVKTAKIIM